jgi:hypothetical protein
MRAFVLCVVVVVSITVAALTAFCSRDMNLSKEWPRDAAQVVATLMIAVVVEQRFFDIYVAMGPSRMSNGLAKVATTIVFFWTSVAFAVSLVHAHLGKAFDPLSAGIVTGGIAALFFFLATLSAFAILEARMRAVGDEVRRLLPDLPLDESPRGR